MSFNILFSERENLFNVHDPYLGDKCSDKCQLNLAHLRLLRAVSFRYYSIIITAIVKIMDNYSELAK